MDVILTIVSCNFSFSFLLRVLIFLRNAVVVSLSVSIIDDTFDFFFKQVGFIL